MKPLFSLAARLLVVGIFATGLTHCGKHNDKADADEWDSDAESVSDSDYSDEGETLTSALTRDLPQSLPFLMGDDDSDFSDSEYHAAIRRTLHTRHVNSRSDDDISCASNADETAITCLCPEGGTITEADIEMDETESEFRITFTTTFDDCVVSSCGKAQKINGALSNVFTISLTNDTDYSLTSQTQDTCSGLTVGNNAYGLYFSDAYQEGTESLSGSFCIGASGETIDFNSLDDLQSQIDPDNSCEAI